MDGVYSQEEHWLKKIRQTIVDDTLDKNDKIVWYLARLFFNISNVQLNPKKQNPI